MVAMIRLPLGTGKDQLGWILKRISLSIRAKKGELWIKAI
jgi:hypothetical protein